MNLATANQSKEKQKTDAPMAQQPVADMEATARQLASYIRTHAVPLNARRVQ